MSLDPITAIIGLVDDVVSGVSASQKEALTLKLQAMNIAAQSDHDQSETNTAEASSGSFYSSGWRPTAGWICVIGLGYNTIILAFLKSIFSICALLGVDPAHITAAENILPQIDMTLLGNMLLQMLGMSTLSVLRTYEKYQGVQGSH